jgi:hypothetical protein
MFPLWTLLVPCQEHLDTIVGDTLELAERNRLLRCNLAKAPVGRGKRG